MGRVNTELVTIAEGEAVVSTADLALGVDYPHKTVIRLVRDNKSDLSEFGRVRFENAPFDTSGGTQHREVALLNEQQATLLMTYMRNSEVVRKFKMRLVAHFYELRAQLQVPQTFSGALRLAADEHDKRLALQLHNQELTNQLQAQIAKVEFHDAVAGSDNLFSIKEAAALLGTGQNRLMAWLRDLNWVDNKNCPYQRKLDEGLMDRKLSQYQHKHLGTQYSVTPMITGKGLARLQKSLAENRDQSIANEEETKWRE